MAVKFMGKKSPGVVFIKELLGIVFFLILLGLLNLIADAVGNVTFLNIVEFFNSNIVFLISISVVMMIGALFGAVWFPFNLPSPVFHALGGVMIVHFIFSLFDFLGGSFFSALWVLYAPALVLVPLIVLVVGYVVIFAKVLGVKCGDDKKKGKKKKGEDWEDVIERKVREGIEKMRGEEEDDKDKRRKKK